MRLNYGWLWLSRIFLTTGSWGAEKFGAAAHDGGLVVY
jgi:hypothetical protein